MRTSSFSRILLASLLGGIILASCYFPSITSNPNVTPTGTVEPTQTIKIVETLEKTATITPQWTQTSTATQPAPSSTPTETPAPTWIHHEPGEITAPILLYHHVVGETSTSRYQVSVPDFRAQMNTLNELGYSAIPISLFLNVLFEGGALPDKPVVITFDDGHLSVYENAFPIMDALNFPGVFYIVANRINGSPEFVDISQLKEMVNAGWEIGSHGYTHADLTQSHERVGYEIAQSKADLETALSTEILTFAYPYGKFDAFVARKVSDFQYLAGMGLGNSTTHKLTKLFYLERREVYGYYTIEDFLTLLNQE
jgi:peptidoglycan/xylan/chitin deacetylase (PgdA/CDA1 family)